MAQVASATIEGTSDPRFELVRQEFLRNFSDRGESGASVCLIVDGRRAVDLWGGLADPEASTPWAEDTVNVVWSSTKGATSLCAHILVDRGELELDAPVARYWPEFAQNGKDAITVRMLLCHQSGVAAVHEPLPRGAFYDWELMTTTLARETPWWEPGTRHGYHGLTFGWLVGEVVRRVSGRSLGTFFREEVAGPLGLDFWIGLPEEHERRVARAIPAPMPQPGEPVSPLLVVAMTQPTSLPAMMFANTAGYILEPGEVDSRAAHAAEIGAAGGITNARGLAEMYAPLAGIGGRQLVGEDTIAGMAAVASAGYDMVGLVPTRFALGYVKSMDNRAYSAVPGDSIVLSEEAFGHSGFGGSVGFADPRGRFSFGYTMTRMGAGTGLNERGQSLVDAVYRSLGYRSRSSGRWI
ncbi:MAG TPA: serine hydrolase domain-containing protein [Candidatus Dormibacteraeota bacterium]|nr:serine hydrolase domain-containing protein [Candidatus Dormibacteraeota bacterium]